MYANIGNNRLSGLTYDAAGNLISDSMNNYQYDAEGNLIAMSGGATASYVYDALNRRVSVTTSAGTTEYMYNTQGQRSSSWIASNNFGNSGRIYWDGRQIAYRAQIGETIFQHKSPLGTDRMRTGYQGTPYNYQHSGPFGDSLAQNSSDQGGGAQDPDQFAGLDHDSESNTEHATFRQYSSSQSRWMSPDPYDGSYDLFNPQSLNRYSYGLNDPLTRTDPAGLDDSPGSDFVLRVYVSTFSDTTEEFTDVIGDASGGWGFGGGISYGGFGGGAGSNNGMCISHCGQGSGSDPSPSNPAPNSFARAGRSTYRTPQQCQALANKINQLLKVIAEKQGDLNYPSGNLIPGAPYAGSVMGHQVKLGDHIDNLASVATEYQQGCGGGPPAPPTNGSPAPSPVPIIVPPVLWPLTPWATGAPMAAEGASAGEILTAIIEGLLAL